MMQQSGKSQFPSRGYFSNLNNANWLNDNDRGGFLPLKKSRWGLQPILTSSLVIHSHPLGYPDQLIPAMKSVTFLQTAPPRIQFEALLADLIPSDALNVQDITLLSPVRKERFYMVSEKGSGEVLLLVHQIPSSRLVLPFYKGNLKVVQNGFRIRMKTLERKVVLTMVRKTLYSEDESDVLEIWLGNEGYPIGRVEKFPLINEYTIYGEDGQPLFYIQKVVPMVGTTNKSDKFWSAYAIFNWRNKEAADWAGYILLKKPKHASPVFSPPKYYMVLHKGRFGLVEKALVLGTVFLLAARFLTRIEKKELEILKSLSETDKEALKKIFDL